MAMNALFKSTYHAQEYNRHRDSRDRLVVRTLRCGRSNPGSNPGHGSVLRCYGSGDFPFWKFFVRVNFSSYKIRGLYKLETYLREFGQLLNFSNGNFQL